MNYPKITVITVCFNSSKTISLTLRSVMLQKYINIEHIIIDGASTDNTLTIVRNEGQHVSQVISEPDEGIYDAMNKGLKLATGDLIGFLNSDDVYADDYVLSDVVKHFQSGNFDYVYGDIKMFNQEGYLVRDWVAGEIPEKGLCSSQIPHPALFMKRSVISTLNPAFDPSYRIAADLKQQLLVINKLGARGIYIKRALAHMSIGGASTNSLISFAAGWRESVRAYNEVFGGGGVWFTIKKVAYKIGGVRKLNQFNAK